MHRRHRSLRGAGGSTGSLCREIGGWCDVGQKPNWTKDELAYLSERWGNVSVPAIAKKLGRSVEAVKLKAGRLGLGDQRLSGDYISLNQLLIAVRGSNAGGGYITTSWVKKRGLPVHTKKIVNKSIRVVYIDEFWQWAEKNRSYIDFTKFEPLALGKEPAWVAEQRKKDHQAFAIQRKDPWTSEDDGRLIMLLKQHKYGYAEMSEILRRSAGAIQRRCQVLGIKERPVKADNRGSASTWTEADFAILAEGIRSGDSYCAISKRLGRSEKAVRGKVYFVYLTEDADKVRQMLGAGEWGDGAPIPTVRQGFHLSRTRTEVRDYLERLAGVLYRRTQELKQGDYDWFFQRKICMKWNELDSFCTAGCTDCDACTEFERVRPQYCARCGGTFYERRDNRFCPDCRTARKRAAQRKWAARNGKNG